MKSITKQGNSSQHFFWSITIQLPKKQTNENTNKRTQQHLREMRKKTTNEREDELLDGENRQKKND